MKVSVNWLQDWIEIKEKEQNQLLQKITDSISEIEEVHSQSQGLEDIVVGEIVKISKHPDADRMQVCKVNVGNKDNLQIVCGANNIREGQKVPVALVGALLPGNFKIKEAEKRGVMSYGMICSESELGLAEESDGILELEKSAQIGKKIIEELKLDDTILYIENTTITNRPDLFSQLGYARELVAANLATWKTGAKKSEDDISISIPKNSDFPFKLEIQDPEICPRSTELVIENYQVKESPEWMKRRLQACGIRPINNLVDITNYVMLELGMPLHAFDLDKLSGKKLRMRRSAEGEKVKTLDGEERKLKKDIIIIEDEKQIIDLCGIMGGENSQISENSQRIWLHAPIYNPTLIRRAAIFLNHRTDASTIYEKEVPLYASSLGLKRAAELMLELCPDAKIVSPMLDLSSKTEEAKKISLNKKSLNGRLGIEINSDFVLSTLENLGFKVENTSNSYECTVPLHRQKDINIPEDIIEEIGRMYGLDNFEPEMPKIKIELSEPEQGFYLEKDLKNFLASFAFENINFSFLSPELLNKMEINGEFIELANPISEHMSIMRPSLLPLLLENVSLNYKNKKNYSAFELSKIYQRSGGKIVEQKNCALLSLSKDVTELKSLLTRFFKEHSIELKFEQVSENTSAQEHPGQTARILFQGKEIGRLSTLHPQISQNFGLNKNPSFFEIRLTEILNKKSKPLSYEKVNKLPQIIRDQNFIADKKLALGPILKTLAKKVPLVKEITLVDSYEGKGVEDSKKRITLRASYQAADRTLTDEEADSSQKILIKEAHILNLAS